MNSELYSIYINNDNKIAAHMPLEFALILIKAAYVEFYAEKGLKITIEREETEETVVQEVE